MIVHRSKAGDSSDPAGTGARARTLRTFASASRSWMRSTHMRESNYVPDMIDSDHLNDLPRPALDLNTSAADLRKIIDDAEKRTLEMIADGASLRDVLDQLW